MTIFKTYEGFFDFLKKKKEKEVEPQEDSPTASKVRYFLENEDRESIKKIFTDEGISGMNLLAIQIGKFNTHGVFSLSNDFSENKDEIIDRINNKQESARFCVSVAYDYHLDTEKIKDVCDLIQSLFDFMDYEIHRNRIHNHNTIVKFTF